MLQDDRNTFRSNQAYLRRVAAAHGPCAGGVSRDCAHDCGDVVDEIAANRDMSDTNQLHTVIDVLRVAGLERFGTGSEEQFQAADSDHTTGFSAAANLFVGDGTVMCAEVFRIGM